MPLVYRNEPDEAAEAVRNRLEQMASKSAFSTPRLRSAFTEKARSPSTEQALPVYNLGLSDLVEETARAIKAAEQKSEIKQGNYEVRLLFIPALYVTALWLVDKEEKADLAIPIEPAPAFLTQNKLMPLEDLLSVLQEKAKSKLESYHGEDTLGG